MPSYQLEPCLITVEGYQASIDFIDRHRAVFESFPLADGGNGFCHFYLFDGVKRVVEYEARAHKASARIAPTFFRTVAPDYTTERILAYWETACDYVQRCARKPFWGLSSNSEVMQFAKMATEQSSGDARRIRIGNVRP